MEPVWAYLRLFVFMLINPHIMVASIIALVALVLSKSMWAVSWVLTYIADILHTVRTELIPSTFDNCPKWGTRLIDPWLNPKPNKKDK